jgi:hypothetical protein
MFIAIQCGVFTGNPHKLQGISFMTGRIAEVLFFDPALLC